MQHTKVTVEVYSPDAAQAIMRTAVAYNLNVDTSSKGLGVTQVLIHGDHFDPEVPDLVLKESGAQYTETGRETF